MNEERPLWRKLVKYPVKVLRKAAIVVNCLLRVPYKRESPSVIKLRDRYENMVVRIRQPPVRIRRTTIRCSIMVSEALDRCDKRWQSIAQRLESRQGDAGSNPVRLTICH